MAGVRSCNKRCMVKSGLGDNVQMWDPPPSGQWSPRKWQITFHSCRHRPGLKIMLLIHQWKVKEIMRLASCTSCCKHAKSHWISFAEFATSTNQIKWQKILDRWAKTVQLARSNCLYPAIPLTFLPYKPSIQCQERLHHTPHPWCRLLLSNTGKITWNSNSRLY